MSIEQVSKSSVLIAGARIGGLAMALSLLRRGIDCGHVLEQASELREVGAGLWISMNGVRVLRNLGLTEQVEQNCIAAERRSIRLWNTGDRWPLYNRSSDAARNQPYLLLRAHLLKILEWKMRPIGYIRSSYMDTQQIPKGLGATHTMEGVLEVLPEFEQGLQDIEGFSHLMILWVFHQAQGCELVGRVPTDNQVHGVFSTRSPRRPNPIGLTVVELISRDGPPSLDFARRWGDDLLQALDVLEEAGIQHRDIKPANLGILPSQAKKKRNLRLFDFSLSAAADSAITAGTPAYRDPFLDRRGRWDPAHNSQLYEEMSRSNQAKDEFLSVMSQSSGHRSTWSWAMPNCSMTAAWGKLTRSRRTR